AARPQCREVRDRRQRRADLGDVDEHLAGNAAEVVLAPGHRAERLDPAERDRGDQVCDQTDRPVDRRRRRAPQGGAEPGRVPLLRVRVARAGHARTLALVGRSRSPAAIVAEEVVADTWLAVVTGLERFEERSALKTWLFRILTNKAKTRGRREARSLPFSSFVGDGDEAETAVVVDRFARDGHWSTPPRGVPEERLLANEARERVEAAIAALPPNQRAVITLRDVEGLSAEEACNVLGLSETNQRVLLHRARAKVRAAFERYLEEGPR